MITSREPHQWSGSLLQPGPEGAHGSERGREVIAWCY
jgi:hypothetical protein